MQITTIIILNWFNGNKVSVRFITMVLETTYTNKGWKVLMFVQTH